MKQWALLATLKGSESGVERSIAPVLSSYGRTFSSVWYYHTRRYYSVPAILTGKEQGSGRIRVSLHALPTSSSSTSLSSLVARSVFREAFGKLGPDTLEKGGPYAVGRRWSSSTATTTTSAPVMEESVPGAKRDSRSALLRLLHDPHDPYLAVIAELDIPAIVMVMKRGPLTNGMHEGPAKAEEMESNTTIEQNKEEGKISSSQEVQHVFDGLCAINAVLRMILEDLPSLEEAKAALDAAYEGFAWIYGHYPHRGVPMKEIEIGLESEEMEEEENTTTTTNDASSAEAMDAKKSEEASQNEPTATHQIGEDDARFMWSITKEKWESDFVVELKELYEMFHAVGERRKIRIA